MRTVLTVIVILAALLAGQVAVAQEEMTKDQWQQEMNKLTETQKSLKEQLKALQDEITAREYGVPLGSGWLMHPTQDWLTFPPSAFFVGKVASIFLSALAALALTAARGREGIGRSALSPRSETAETGE